MSSVSPRNTQVELLLRKAAEFESDARIRFSVEGRLDECLGAIRAMIDDMAKSNRTNRQLEQIADRLDKENFEHSFDETFTKLVFDLVCITKIDLVAYPGIFETEKQSILGRMLSLAYRIGFPREQARLLLKIFEKHGNPEERLDEIENQFQLFLQSPHDEHVPVSLLNSLGLVPGPCYCSWGVDSLVVDTDIYVNPIIIRRALATAFEETTLHLTRYGFNYDGLLLIQEMWVLLRSANHALMNMPKGYIGFDELYDLDSPLSEIPFLLENPRTGIKTARIQEITGKLKDLIPVIEDYVDNDVYWPVRDMRSRLISKINSALFSAETRIILKPLLLRLVDRFFYLLLKNSPFVKALKPDEFAGRWFSFPEILVEGCIEAIQREEASRISVAEFIRSEITRASCSVDMFDLKSETRLLSNILRSAFEFARQFGVRVLENRQDWSSERMENFRLVISACNK